MNENEIEIILSGVNVSGCEWLNNNKAGLLCGLCDYKVVCCSRCADNPNCYYKQLQRLRAEYKRSEYLPIAARLEKQFGTFKQTKGIEYDGILSEWLKENEKLAKDINVLRKTLKEIEEIAERDCLICCYGYEYEECGDKGCTNSKILEKTKEVENEQL